MDDRAGRAEVRERARRPTSTLEWATYYDAADQAGLSRLYGGIHIAADDFNGRIIGSECGKEAWALAQHYYDGTAGRDAVGARARSAVAAPRVGLAVVAVVVAGRGVAGAALAAAAERRRPPALPAPRFVDETAASGIEHTLRRRATGSPSAAGVAVLDCDDDGRPDLYLAGGDRPGGAVPQRERGRRCARGSRAVDDPATDLTGVTGAYPLDIDGDGIADLAVLRVGENVLLRGLGDCRFERANEALGARRRRRLDDGVQRDLGGRGGAADARLRHYLDARRRGRDARRLRRQRAVPARRRRAPATARRSRSTPGYCTLSMLFSDWDRSGRRDLRVSNDRHYYAATARSSCGGSTPGEAPRALHRATTAGSQMQIWGMGIASHDLTGDGLPGGLPHEPGRQQAPDAGRRRRRSRPTATSRSSAA